MKKLTLILLIAISFNSFAQTKYDKLVEEGLQLLIQQNVPAAIIKYEAAYKIDSTKVEVNYGLGIAYLNNCQEKNVNCNKSLLFLNKAIQIDDSYRKGYFNRSQYKGLIGNYKEALIDINSAIKQNPNLPEYYFSRGMIKIKLKEDLGACEDFYKSGILGSEKGKRIFNLNCEAEIK